MLLHFLLLHRVTDEDGAVRETRLAPRVLGMEMRGGEKELGVIGRKLGHDAGDGGSIFRTHPGIHHQGSAATDHDSDVGEAHDRPHVIGNLDRVFTNHRMVLS